jgi:hypothetical protein
MDSTRIVAGFRFRFAKAIAVALPLGAVLYLTTYSLERKAWRESSRVTVPEQVASLRASSVDNPFIGNVQVGSATRRRCLASLAGESAFDLTWESGSPALDSALAARHPDCPFTLDVHRPFVFSHSVAITTALASALAIALAFLGSFEVYRYPHVGWRRIAVLTGVVAAVGMLALQYFDYLWSPYGVIAVPATGFLSAFSVVGAREITLWIRDGFENSSRHDGAA